MEYLTLVSARDWTLTSLSARDWNLTSVFEVTGLSDVSFCQRLDCLTLVSAKDWTL